MQNRVKTAFLSYFLISLLIIILYVSFDSLKLAHGQGNSSLYTLNSSPFGIPYKDWIVKWWQWDLSIPVPDHPNTNYTPDKCSRGQDSKNPVFYLAVPFTEEQQSERTCTIPKDKPIITALLSGECDLSDPRLTTDDSIKQCAKEGDDYGSIQVFLDGVDLKYDMKQNRIMSDFFNMTNPENNIFQSKAGIFRSIVDGYFLFLKPLPPGEHKLEFKVSVLNPTKTEYNYFQDVIYHLNIT